MTSRIYSRIGRISQIPTYRYLVIWSLRESSPSTGWALSPCPTSCVPTLAAIHLSWISRWYHAFRFVRSFQVVEIVRQDGKILSGMLNLNVNPMWVRFSQIQEQIGTAIIKVAEEVWKTTWVRYRMCLEMPGPWCCERHTMGQKGIYPQRWFLSGCAVTFGLRSAFPIGIERLYKLHEGNRSLQRCLL